MRQDKTTHNSTISIKTSQHKAIQDNPRTANTSKNKTIHVKTIEYVQDKTRQDNTTRYNIRQDATLHCNIRQCKTRLGKSMNDKKGQDKTRQ